MRELCERGERTEVGFVVFEVAVVVVVLARLVFFCTGRVSGAKVVSFSLSEAIWMEGLLRFLPRVAAAAGCARTGEVGLCC